MKFFTPKAATAIGDRSPWGSFWFSNFPGQTSVNPQTALGLTVVYACVKILAESFATMPYMLFRQKADGSRGSRVNKHWSIRIFTKSPNRFQTPFEWRMMLMGHMALRGNAFCQISANGNGDITELLPLNPDRMTVEMLDGGNYRFQYVDQMGKTIRYRRDEIWHLRLMSDGGILGVNPIEQCRESLSEGLAMQSYSNRFFANDAKPGGGWIEVAGKFANSADKQTFRDSWQQLQGGANRGKVAVLENGMKFHELAMSNSDAQFIEARAAKISDLCRIWRVPPHMVGDLSKATFSNIEQQSIDFWTNTMHPLAELWESSIEYFLFGEDAALEVEFDMRSKLRGDSVARSAYYTQGINGGWLTRNEAREMEGLPRLDDLDEPLVPLNMVPADQLGEQPEPEEPDDEEKPPQAPTPPGKTPKPPKESSERIQALVTGNAHRMARRVAAGQAPSWEVLAEAMALSRGVATSWLELDKTGIDEQQLAESLVDLWLRGMG